MNKRWLGWAALSVAAMGFQASASAGDYSVVRVFTTDPALIRQWGTEHDHLLISREKGQVMFEADAMQIEALRRSKLAFEIDAEATAALEDQAKFFVRAKAGIPGYTCYRTVAETHARLTALTSLYPQLASLVDIGDTWEKTASLGGEDMRLIRLTNAAVAGDKPKLFLMTSIHAREYTPAETSLRFVEWLLTNYGVDADATWMLDHQEIHVLVQANPDGRKQAETGLSWRKNTNRGYCSPTSSSRGADLNRNFPFKWGQAVGGGGSSTSPCSETFRGPSAGSEPEVQAVVNYLPTIYADQRGPAITDPAPDTATGIFLDLHSYSSLVLWPWGYTQTGSAGFAPNAAQLETLGRRFAWYNRYTPEQSNELYATDGTTDDHAYGELGIAAYTFELGTAFFESCANFESTVYPDNLAALIYAARTVRAPYRWPAGPEAREVRVSPDLIVAGDSARVVATVDDGRFNQGNGGTQVVHDIASASAYIDTPPWSAGALATALGAEDGGFDASSEIVAGALNTSGLSVGKHLVYVQGRDAASSEGPPAAAFVEVASPAEVGQLGGVITDARTGAPLAGATVRTGTLTVGTLADGTYTRRLRGGTYTLEASAIGYEAETVSGVNIVAGQNVTRDVQLYSLCTLIDENAENGGAGWTTQVLAGSNTWGIVNANAVTTTKAWTESPAGTYGNNINTALLSPVRDLTGYASPVLSFDSYCDTEAGYDYGIVEFSTNGGTSWTEVWRCNGDPSWQRVAIALPALAGTAQARLRLRTTSDTGVVEDGWYVDNLQLNAGGPACRNAAVVSAPGVPDLADTSDTGAANGDNITNAAMPRFTGACVTGDSIQLKSGATSVGSPVICAGNQYEVSAALAEGPHVISTVATRTGINSAPSATLTITIDRTAPIAPTITMNAPSYAPAPTIQGTMVENQGVVTVSEGATTVCSSAALTVASANAWSCASTLGVGSHVLTARHTDLAGNVSAASGNATVSIGDGTFADGFE